MDEHHTLHEDFRHAEKAQLGTPRAFGLVFAIVFVGIAIWPLLNGHPLRIWSLVVSGIFFLISILVPSLLNPLNRLWFHFGLLLHKIVNPLVMGGLFFITITPIAIIFKITGKDPLHRKMDKNRKTYWIERNPKELTPESMKNQF